MAAAALRAGRWQCLTALCRCVARLRPPPRLRRKRHGCRRARPRWTGTPEGRRIWPIAEAIKANLVEARRGRPGAEARAVALAELLRERFLNCRSAGGWHDRVDQDGKCLSQFMPASTLYHLLGAVDELNRSAQRSRHASRQSEVRRGASLVLPWSRAETMGSRVGHQMLQLRVVPLERELAGAIVLGALLVVEDRLLAHHHVPVAELGRHQHLQAICVREREGLPVAVLRANSDPC